MQTITHSGFFTSNPKDEEYQRAVVSTEAKGNMKYHVYEDPRRYKQDNKINSNTNNTNISTNTILRRISNKYKLILYIKAILLFLVIYCIAGCSTQFIDTDTSKHQANTVISVLDVCTKQPIGIVGDTNISLARAYLKSTESLLVCQEVAQGVIDGLTGIHKEEL